MSYFKSENQLFEEEEEEEEEKKKKIYQNKKDLLCLVGN